MRRVRVIDYLANPGGGCRFVAEMLRAFAQVGDARFEVVSHGAGLERYRRIVRGNVGLLDLPPRNALHTSPPLARVRGFSLAYALLGLPEFHFDVPQAALEGCDVAWFPWIHRHRLPPRQAAQVFGTFHDCIALEFPGVVPERLRRDETETTRRWLSSSARTLVTSHATEAALGRLFPGIASGFAMIPLSSKHDRPPSSTAAASRFPFATGRYLVCPTNLTPHKNVEGLLEGFARWRARVPLVLTGPGMDLANGFNPRQRLLRSVMSRHGLVMNRDVFAVGFLEEADYYAVLDGAWALVTPTLAEGGGSFPVLEAIEQGIPVLSSDIPVMREMAERWNARLIWFDARSPDDTASQLAALEACYDEHRRAAKAQVTVLLQRSWEQVAGEYAEVMGLGRTRDAHA